MHHTGNPWRELNCFALLCFGVSVSSVFLKDSWNKLFIELCAELLQKELEDA